MKVEEVSRRVMLVVRLIKNYDNKYNIYLKLN